MSEAIEPRKPTHRFLLIAIAILLLLSTAATITQLVLTIQQNANTAEQDAIVAAQAATYEARVKEARALVDKQQEVILGLITEYKDTAYDNPLIDRIAEQQLLATESTLAALQIIAIQNSQVIELLAAAP